MGVGGGGLCTQIRNTQLYLQRHVSLRIHNVCTTVIRTLQNILSLVIYYNVHMIIFVTTCVYTN